MALLHPLGAANQKGGWTPQPVKATAAKARTAFPRRSEAWHKTRGELAAAVSQAYDRHWEDKPARGKARAEGSVIGIRFIAVLNMVLTNPPFVPKSKRKKGTPRRPHSFEVMTGTMIEQLDKTWICSAKSQRKARTTQGPHNRSSTDCTLRSNRALSLLCFLRCVRERVLTHALDW